MKLVLLKPSRETERKRMNWGEKRRLGGKHKSKNRTRNKQLTWGQPKAIPGLRKKVNLKMMYFKDR